MPLHRVTKSLLALAAVSAALVAVPACSVVDEVVYQRHSSSFEDVSAMTENSGLRMPWIPADATAIQVVESTREAVTDAAVLLASSSELDPTVCAPVERQSAPSLTIEGAPDVYGLSTVYACGAWTVAPADDGWYGWTPNHPDEEAQTPSP